jgi:2-oxoglutarate dehydrogenase E2 component (dihydrolipoamide succinyltransferase)
MAKIIIPSVGESVTEATITKWNKKPGDQIQVDEVILEIETDKVTLEVNSQDSGILESILKKDGETVSVGEVVGIINQDKSIKSNLLSKDKTIELDKQSFTQPSPESDLAPSVRKIIAENTIDPKNIVGTGKDGRIIKHDAISYVENTKNIPSSSDISVSTEKNVERVKMSRLRQTISTRLKQAQNTAAILTTFNEFDMTNIMRLRKTYQESFQKVHNVKLGFMSFFVKAVISGLKAIPAINAEIDGDYIIYKNYYDIGVAVGTNKGLVVPVIRAADQISLSDIEKNILDLSTKARDGKLSIPDLSGGTFSITNGGIFGSLLSTPIINPPQSAILGLHAIQQRAVVIDSKIEIRHMMYAALSYDHRIIDGQEAVTFLIKVKQIIENPELLLLNL